MSLRSEIMTHNADVFCDGGDDAANKDDPSRADGGAGASQDWLQSVSFGDQQLYKREEQRL
jgi:hypothetical protein